MAEGVMFAHAPCFTCGDVFGFDPDAVPSVIADGATGQPVPPGGRMPNDPVKRPVCPRCVRGINRRRAERGMAPHWPEEPPTTDEVEATAAAEAGRCPTCGAEADQRCHPVDYQGRHLRDVEVVAHRSRFHAAGLRCLDGCGECEEARR